MRVAERRSVGRRPRWVESLFICVWIAQTGCQIGTSSAPDLPEPSTEVPRAARAWRLASPHELSRVVIWTKHILIRHAEAEASQAPLVGPDWKVLPPPPSRSPQEALLLAQRLARTARLAPGTFGELALANSEDTTTRDREGDLGGLVAANLLLWVDVLDALASLPTGGISDAIESPWGFHVFQRVEPPEADVIEARRIVIGYRDAGWLQFNERPEYLDWSSRSRQEALAQSKRLFEELSARPDKFEELVTRHSEHWDAVQGGDVGAWSSREPNPNARAFSVLRRLTVGEITEPIDSFLGYTIWQRTAQRPRETYAADVLRFRYDPSLPEVQAGSKSSAAREASAALGELKTNPWEFSRWARTHGAGLQQWSAGRGLRGVEAVIDATSVDAIADRVVDADWAFLVVKRVTPNSETAPPEPLMSFPGPANPDLDCYLARLGDEPRSELLRAAWLDSGALREFSPEEAIRFSQMAKDLAGSLSHQEDDLERCTSVAVYMARFKYRLGIDAFERFQNVLSRKFTQELLR